MPVLSYISGFTSHHGKKWDIMRLFGRKRRKPTNLIEAIESHLRLENDLFYAIYSELLKSDELVECMPYRTKDIELPHYSNN